MGVVEGSEERVVDESEDNREWVMEGAWGTKAGSLGDKSLAVFGEWIRVIMGVKLGCTLALPDGTTNLLAWSL